MKRSITTIALLITCHGFEAIAGQPAPANRVVVYLDTGAVPVTGVQINMARQQATWLFKPAGIQLEWRDGDPKADETGCWAVGIRFLPTAPADFASKAPDLALAFARPSAMDLRSITVIWDRVQALMAPYDEWERGKVLGHVLAHELGHVLEGVSRHSKTGLMKPLWNPRDYGNMAGPGLQFAAEDLVLLRAGFAMHVARRPAVSM